MAFKRDRFIFASNLSEHTCHPDSPITFKREGYLLSAAYADKRKVSLAKIARHRRNLIISDNGNFTTMSAMAKKKGPKAKPLLVQAKQQYKKKGHIDSELHATRDDILEQIATDASLELSRQNYQKLIAKQLEINPHYLIGLEDLTIPTAMLSGLFDPVFIPKAAEILPFQQITYELCERQINGEFGFNDELKKRKVFVVVHAYDYETAFQAGAMLRNKSFSAFAISYGGPMKSKRWVNTLKVGLETYQWDYTLPEMYMIAQSITKGFLDGIERKVDLHILGLGSPIMILLSALFLDRVNYLSIDSSAPLKDAFESRLFLNLKYRGKMDMYKLLAYHYSLGKKFKSGNPFFKYFNERYPLKWNTVASLLNIIPGENIRSIYKKLKRNPSIVDNNLPFFTYLSSREDDFIRSLRVARSGFNYWTIKNICDHVRKRMDNYDELRTWVQKEVNRYQKNASPKWGQSLQIAYELSF